MMLLEKSGQVSKESCKIQHPVQKFLENEFLRNGMGKISVCEWLRHSKKMVPVGFEPTQTVMSSGS